MKRAILTIITCQLLISGLSAQVVSKKTFDSAVDYVNCKFAEFSLRKVNESKFSNECNCEKYPDYETIKNAIPSHIGATKELVVEIEKFKREYKNDLNEQDAADLILAKMVNDNRYKNIKQFDTSRKNDEGYQALKINLKSSINGIIHGKNEPAGIERATDDEYSTGTTSTPTKTEQRDSGKWLPYILVFIMSLIFSMALFMFFGVPMIQKKMQLVMDKERNDRSIGSSELENRLNNLEADFQQLKTDISGLRRDIKDAQRVENKTITNPAPTPTPAPPIQDVLFFPSPSADGKFFEANGSTTFKQGISMYKLVRTSNNRAQFRIADIDDAVRLALSSPSNITPVCNSENNFERGYRRIVTKQDGIAELEGDKWVVKSNNKAIIRYEY